MNDASTTTAGACCILLIKVVLLIKIHGMLQESARQQLLHSWHG
jgi:hypothetical protein